ncbi:MAG TPA: class I SAM-dependent methyltransferase [Candidatus Nanoarchaeia archaeon]|nr:class I SAM-dependent methyltransferase [Candidatus Nanoarchaeia archaeon]
MQSLKTLYERFWGDLYFIRRYEWSEINKHLGNLKGKNALDLACGGGFFTEKLAKKGALAKGIDADENTIKIARKYHNKPNVAFTTAKAEKLPYPRDFFDIVVSVCAMQHFENDEKAMREINRVLKPSGKLILSVDSFSYPGTPLDTVKMHQRKEHVLRLYTKESMKEKLERNGFKVVSSKYIFTSPLSSGILRLRMRSGNMPLLLLFFPLLYYPVRISDFLFKTNKGGYILILAAINTQE